MDGLMRINQVLVRKEYSNIHLSGVYIGGVESKYTPASISVREHTVPSKPR